MTHAWSDDPSTPAPRARNLLTEGEWDALRRDYLNGYTGRELAERFGVGLSTIRQKARLDQWRRRERPEDPDLVRDDDAADLAPAPGPSDPYDPVIADVEDWSDMTSGVRTMLRRAIKAGNPVEAASWMRLYERLRTRTLAAEEALEDGASADAPSAPKPPEPARPDHLDRAMEKALRVEKLTRQLTRAVESGDRTAMAEAEAAIADLRAPRPGQADAPSGYGAMLAALRAEMTDAVHALRHPDSLDSLDSLDPVFSDREESSPRSWDGAD